MTEETSLQGLEERVLILGASSLQVPALKRAKQLGFRVGVVDWNPEAVGREQADHFFEVSTTDIEGVLEVARQFRPRGIMTAGTDAPMKVVAAVGAALGLVAPSCEAVNRATDKGLMAQAFGTRHVPAPRFVIATSALEMTSLLFDWEFPLVFKPVDSSGSRGVTIVERPSDISTAFAYSQQFSHEGRVIAQEYLVGEEISVEGICIGSELHIVAITDKITTGAPHFVELGHTQPSRYSVDQGEEIRSVTALAVEALGLENCGIHGEIMMTDSGPRIIEIGARLGGDFITSHLVPLSTGVDLVGAVIKMSCGESADLNASEVRSSAIRYLPTLPGLPSVKALRDARSLTGVFVAEIDSAAAPNREIASSTDRVGYVIAVGADRSLSSQACLDAVDLLVTDVSGKVAPSNG